MNAIAVNVEMRARCPMFAGIWSVGDFSRNASIHRGQDSTCDIAWYLPRNLHQIGFLRDNLMLAVINHYAATGT